MPLSAQTLYPFTATSHELPYTHDRPLRYIATRYAPITPAHNSASIPCTLLLIGGISLNQETWLPVIKHIHALTSKPGSPIHVHAAWTVERPNHGDAALLNEQELKQYYSVIFPSLQHAAAIRAFLASDALSQQERANLIAVGHSGGGGSILQSLQPATANLPLRTLILVESPHVDHAAFPAFKVMYEIVKRSNLRRTSSWATHEDAMQWMRTHVPWKGFHPDILNIISETYFRPDPAHPGHITTKTTPEQETACFLDDGTHLGSLDYLRTILHVLPTHLILGSVKDIWPPALYKQIDRNIEQDRAALASISTIDGVGHYIPAEKPEQLAQEIVRILGGVGAGAACSRL